MQPQRTVSPWNQCQQDLKALTGTLDRLEQDLEDATDQDMVDKVDKELDEARKQLRSIRMRDSAFAKEGEDQQKRIVKLRNRATEKWASLG